MSKRTISRKRQKKLTKDFPTFEKFKAHFEVGNELQEKLIAEAEKEGITFVEEEFEKSKPFLLPQIKAIIARDLWETSNFFQIANERNETYKKAVEILRAKEEQSILTR